MAQLGSAGHHWRMPVIDISLRSRMSNVPLADLIADGWDPDSTIWHVFAGDGEYLMVPTWLSYGASDVPAFTRVAENQYYEGATNGPCYFDVFKRD